MRMSLEEIMIQLIAYIPKVFAVVIGAIFSLVLSGDIDARGRLKLSLTLAIKVTFAIVFSLYAGEAYIELKGYQHLSSMTQGFIMLIFAVFGVTIIGVIYQAIKMMHGKSLSEIAEELGRTIDILFRRKK